MACSVRATGIGATVVDDRLAVTSGVQSVLARGRGNRTAALAEAIRSAGAATTVDHLGGARVRRRAGVRVRASAQLRHPDAASDGRDGDHADGPDRRMADAREVRADRARHGICCGWPRCCCWRCSSSAPTRFPSALGLHGAGQFGATRVLGDLIVAAVFAAAALTPTDRIVTDRRGWIATDGRAVPGRTGRHRAARAGAARQARARRRASGVRPRPRGRPAADLRDRARSPDCCWPMPRWRRLAAAGSRCRPPGR